jgi:hypothetical protein
VVTFYGDSATVQRKLAEVDRDLLERRMYLIAIESREGSQVSLFERVEGQNISLSRWQGSEESGFEPAIARTLLENRGKLCAGQLTKELLGRYPASHLGDTQAPAPKTLPAAYQLARRGGGEEEYLRVSVILLC